MENENALNERKGNGRQVMLRVLRAVLLANAVYSLIFWAYIVLRVVINDVWVSDLIIDGVPYFSYWTTGIFIFIIGYISLIAYLAIRDPSKPLIVIR